MDEAKVEKVGVEAVEDARPEKNTNETLKEIKGLIWLAVITAWLIACMILITSSANYSTMKQTGRLMDEFGNVRTEFTSNATKVNQSVENGLNRQAVLAKQIKKELAADISRMAESMEKMLADHRALSDQVRKDVASGAGKMNTTAGKMNASVKRIIAKQDALVKEMNGLVRQVNSLHGSERMKVLRKFIENQTLMLNQLSETLDSPPEKPAKKK